MRKCCWMCNEYADFYEVNHNLGRLKKCSKCGVEWIEPLNDKQKLIMEGFPVGTNEDFRELRKRLLGY